jgi:hypothetical protein
MAEMSIAKPSWLADGIDRSRFANADKAMKAAFRRADAASSD